jgi:PIN domain nuclease of toxin-antitoxin system
MKVLLDTLTFIRWDSTPDQLPAEVLDVLQNPATKVLLSVVSVWELGVKRQLGKLTSAVPLARLVLQQQTNGLEILPLTMEHVLFVDSLPPIHRDPFDRLLIAQASVENAVVLTSDPVFSKYPVQVKW